MTRVVVKLVIFKTGEVDIVVHVVSLDMWLYHIGKFRSPYMHLGPQATQMTFKPSKQYRK